MDHVCGGACGGGWAQGGRKNCLVVKLVSNLTLCFCLIFCMSIDTKNLAKNQMSIETKYQLDLRFMNDPLFVFKRTMGCFPASLLSKEF